MTYILNNPLFYPVIIYLTKDSGFKNDFPEISIGSQKQTGREYIYGFILQYSLETHAETHVAKVAIPENDHLSFVPFSTFKEYERASQEERHKYIFKINGRYMSSLEMPISERLHL